METIRFDIAPPEKSKPHRSYSLGSPLPTMRCRSWPDRRKNLRTALRRIGCRSPSNQAAAGGEPPLHRSRPIIEPNEYPEQWDQPQSFPALENVTRQLG